MPPLTTVTVQGFIVFYGNKIILFFKSYAFLNSRKLGDHFYLPPTTVFPVVTILGSKLTAISRVSV